MDMVVEALNGGHSAPSPVVKTESESPNTTKKNRIIYDKEFLVECFKHPASLKKPSGFPLPNLECTLAIARGTKTPYIVMNPKKREEGLRKEKENVDSISLRPQSQSFASGCAANLTSAQLNQGLYPGRFQGNEDQPGRSFFESREYPPRPASSRFASTKSTSNETSERGRGEKERDREKDRDRDVERDHSREHDPENRSAFRKGYGRGAPVWTGEADPPSWTNNRRRINNGNAVRYEREREHNRSDRHHDSRDRNYRDKAEEEVPDWFSDGPTSRLDTIELTGFKDDIRNEIRNKSNKPTMPMSSLPNPMAKNQSNGFAAIDSAAMLSISYSDEKNETEKPTGTSRFTDIFVRNSVQREKEVVPEPEPLKTAPTEDPKDISSDSEHNKPQGVHDLGVALRNILFRDAKPELRTSAADNAEFLKMVESMAFKRQVQEEERFAIAVNKRKIENDKRRAVAEAAAAREAAFRNSEGMAMTALEAQEQFGVQVQRRNSSPLLMPQPHLPQSLQQFEQQQQQQRQHHPQMMGSQHVPGMYFSAPNTSANFMQPAPGMPINVPGMMSGHGMEPPLPHQFPVIHSQPQPFVNPYPMYTDFMPTGQFQHNRMQMPYPYPNHPNLINQNQNQNPLQIFQDHVRQQHWGVQTPAQVYSLLTQEYKKLVDNTMPTADFLNRVDVKKIVNNLASGAMSMNDLLQQIVGPQQTIMAGILRHALLGGFPIRGVFYGGHGMMPSQMQGGQFSPHTHFVPNYVRMGGYQLQQQPSQRPTGQMMQPISFMPTSVMRKMTAEQHVRQIIPTPGTSNPQQPVETQNAPTQDGPNLNVEN